MDTNAMMNEDFAFIGDFCKKNSKELSKIRADLRSFKRGENQNMMYIIGDLVFIYDTILSLEYCVNNPQIAFMNVTTFVRTNIETIYIVMEKMTKVANTLESNNSLRKEINQWYHEWINNKKIRNAIEHGLGMEYNDNYRDIYECISLEKQLAFLNKSVSYLKKLQDEKPKYNPQELTLKIKNIQDQDKRRICTETNKQNKKIMAATVEISYIVEESYFKSQQDMFDGTLSGLPRTEIAKKIETNQDLSYDLRVIFDMSIKLAELNKAVIKIFNPDDQSIMLMEDSTIYFLRLAVSRCYQICDKMGYFCTLLDKSYGNDTYFKAICEKIEIDNGNRLGFEKQLLELRKSDEYDSISKLRNYTEHKMCEFDYLTNSDELFTAIIFMYAKISQIICDIIDIYFCKKKIVISEKAFLETERIGKYEKI